MTITKFSTFAEAHPLRIDLRDGSHVRFCSILVAAQSALFHGASVYDEAHGQTISLDECRMIVNRRAA